MDVTEGDKDGSLCLCSLVTASASASACAAWLLLREGTLAG